MKFNFRFPALALAACSCLTGISEGAERPTFNHDTCDPRPDILPYHIHHAIPEYRREYNRPRFWSGWIAHTIAPTSQEAMVWCENYQAGAYDEHHAPPRYKRYFAPKPWEVLPTGSRPDFPEQESLGPSAMELDGQDEANSPSDVEPLESVGRSTPPPVPGSDSASSRRAPLRNQTAGQLQLRGPN